MRFADDSSHYFLSVCLFLPMLWNASYSHAAKPPSRLPTVFVATVIQTPFTDKLEALGTLRANESLVLTASVTETITRIHFDDGDRVKQGQILVEMTDKEEHAQLEEFQARTKEAKRQYERVVLLAAEGTAAKSLLDERKREWQTARAQLAGIVSRIDDRLIRAPFDGIVGLRNISVGALMIPGNVITTLDDDRVMKLDFSVSSNYLEVLRPGLTVIAKARALPGRPFEGEIKSIDSRIDPVTRSVMVRALLDNKDRILKPGLLMQIDLLRNPREALVIPEESLVPLGEKQFVLVVDQGNGNKVSRREVHIGSRRPGEVEILKGLQVGEKIITDGSLKVRPGQSVTIKASDDGKQTLTDLLNNAAKKKSIP